MIDRALIERVLQLTRIDEVISPYVPLKRRGANLLGLCPFHKEKTPSFTVSVSKGIYKCFGCGKSGNALGFLMDIEHISFIEALRRLADRCGIDLQERPETAEELEARNHRERLMEVMAWANDYFHKQLMQTGEGRKEGLAYFTDRGLSPEMVESFQLGYSPDAYSAVTEAGLQRGFTLDELVAVGLTGTKGNNAYDRFRGRVIFPIHSLSSRVLAFAGRALQMAEQTAKYVNSPATELYQKGDMLFGLWKAKQEIVRQGRAIVVEGYMDVLSMHQLGVTNVVATSGTSLTTSQASLLRRFTNQITLLYDGDSAGIKAAERALDILLEEGLAVEVVLLPEGKDPDDFARSHTLEEVKRYLVDEAKDLIRFKGRTLFSGANQSAADKASITHSVMESIAMIEDPITRSAYTYELAKEMHIALDVISEQVALLRNQRQKNANTKLARALASSQETPPGASLFEQIETTEQHAEGKANRDNTVWAKQELPLTPFEREILYWLLLYGDKSLYHPIEIEHFKEQHAEDGLTLEGAEITVAEFIIQDMEADDLHFETPLLRAIYDEYISAYRSREHPSIEWFIQSSNPDIAQVAIDMVVTSYTLSRRWTLRARDMGFKCFEEDEGEPTQESAVNFEDEANAESIFTQDTSPLANHTDTPTSGGTLREHRESQQRREFVEEAMMAYKGRVVERMVQKLLEELNKKELPQEKIMEIYQELNHLQAMRAEFKEELQRSRL